MTWLNNAEKWISFNKLDHDLKEKLLEMDIIKKLLEDSFYKHLEFGTGGMRGELGPGTNRLNTYTIRRAFRRACTVHCGTRRSGETTWCCYCL